MRAHQNTILAMKISTLLMSLSAVVLIILLLTSTAVANQSGDASNSSDSFAEVAPADASQLVDTAPPPSNGKTRLVIMRIVAVTATPDARATDMAFEQGLKDAYAAAPTNDDAQFNSVMNAPWPGSVEVAEAPVNAAVTVAKAAQTVVAAAPAAQKQAPASNNNNNNGGGQPAPKPAPAPAPKPAPAPAPAPKPAPAPAPAPKPAPAPAPAPQPKVQTKTS